MHSQEFVQTQIQQIDRSLVEVRNNIEALMRTEEYLVSQQAKWQALGRTAIQLPEQTSPPKLHVIDGGLA